MADRIAELVLAHEAQGVGVITRRGRPSVTAATRCSWAPGWPASWPSVLPAGATRAAIVTQAGIGFAVDPGREHRTFEIGDGEAAKTLATVEELCRAWAAWGLTRADVVVAVGGGLVTDMAGFAAASYHRGVPVVHVPTTLLGMVDAAIGGKTGVNLPGGQEPGGRVLAARRRALRHRCPGDAPAPRAPLRPGRAGQVPLPHRRRPARARPGRAHRRRRPHQGRRRGRRRAGGPATTAAGGRS